MKFLRDLLHGEITERGSVGQLSSDTGDFTGHTFNQVTNGHTTGNSVRIDDHIGVDALTRVGHVLGSIRHPKGSFLTVSTGKFVADLRNSNTSNLDFHEFLAVVIVGYHHLVDHAIFRTS